ncbi:MAG: hypothetical protein NC483_07015, partial [Ruminococcus sp.]|nr:hypothetical protein [Ruminococcus sp.]
MKLGKLKDNKKVIYGVMLVLLLILSVTMLVSRARYRVTAIYELAEGTVKSNPYDFNIISMYISDDSANYEEINIMPNSGYVINDEKSFCYIGNKDNIDRDAKLYTNSNGEHIISNLIKGDKCILYFDKTFTMEERLANYYTNKSERNTFNESFVTTTSNTVFTASDDDGTSYYFGGNPTDNWVKFGGYYWRIIRINGDGSIRMIYQGTAANTTGTGTQIGTSAFNSSYNNNMYVGYFYTSNQLRGLGTASTIYT